MPYHHLAVKKFILVIFLGGCFLWTKRDLVKQQLPSQFTNDAGFPEFGLLPITPDFPIISEIEKLQIPVTPLPPEISIAEE